MDKSKQLTNADTNPPSPPPPPKSMQFYAVKSEPQSKHKVAASKKTDGNNEGDQFVCEICNNKYKRALNLQLHMEKVHSILGGPEPPPSGVVPESHKCETCKREFTNVESLKGSSNSFLKITHSPVLNKSHAILCGSFLLNTCSQKIPGDH